MKYLILFTLLLVSCNHEKPEPHVLGKYELSTDREVALKQCKAFFNKFHGKYRKTKSYGKVENVSTLQFFSQPDCASACITNQFYWQCSFQTNDDDLGFMDFVSAIFEDNR